MEELNLSDNGLGDEFFS